MMSWDSLPEEIKEHIIQKTEEDFARVDNHLYVTELTDCIRKAYFERKSPIEPDFERRFFVYRGKIFHELWAPLFQANDVRVTHRLKGVPAIISGRIDFVKNGAVYELKTCRTPPAKPREHHIWQVSAYAWMGGYTKAFLVYVSFEPPKIFEIPLDRAEEIMEELERRAKVLYQALANDVPPEPLGKWEWSCDYCLYREKCESEDIAVEPDWDDLG